MSNNPHQLNKYDSYTTGGQCVDLPNKLHAIVRVMRDEDMGPPWEEHDGHGIVSEWTTRDKRPGERVLVSDRRSKRYYDIQKTTALAKRDGWGVSPELAVGKTRGQIVAMAVEADFENLRDWCNDKWHWIGVSVELLDANDREIGHDSCWGFESNSDYWIDLATEYIDNLFETEMKSRHDAWRSALKERRERAYWSQRDVVTV